MRIERIVEQRMAIRSRFRQRGAHGLGVIFLILSLVHIPLPQPDFHNIRHHHGPGEVCEHHDHLLRWHPTAGFAEDVATLHWHWFLPLEEGAPAAPENGPALHAHIPAWFASTWDDGPRILPDHHSELVARVSALPQAAALPPDLIDPRFSAMGILRPDHLGAPGARQPSPTSLVERWLC